MKAVFADFRMAHFLAVKIGRNRTGADIDILADSRIADIAVMPCTHAVPRVRIFNFGKYAQHNIVAKHRSLAQIRERPDAAIAADSHLAVNICERLNNRILPDDRAGIDPRIWRVNNRYAAVHQLILNAPLHDLACLAELRP